MPAIRKSQFQRAGILLVALPALVWFPWGFVLVFVSGEQLLFGFDDMPVGPMLLSLGLGVVIAVVALVIVCRGVRRGALRLPFIITAAAAIFGMVSVPLARLMTKLEEDRRSRQHAPHQATAENRRPAWLRGESFTHVFPQSLAQAPLAIKTTPYLQEPVAQQHSCQR